MQRFLLVCLGGALGTGARYAMAVWAGKRFGGEFPYGTLLVNVAGCFLAAAVLELAVSAATFPPDVRFALVTGFCGGLTTYSSFNYEATKLLQSAAPAIGVSYFAVTVLTCFAAGLAGSWLVTRFVAT